MKSNELKELLDILPGKYLQGRSPYGPIEIIISDDKYQHKLGICSHEEITHDLYSDKITANIGWHIKRLTTIGYIGN